MTQYKGYFVDHIVFDNKQDIDEHIKAQAIETYKRAIRYFLEKGDMETSIYADEKAEYLVSQCGMTWEQVEAIEIETYKAIA